jgi:hypothetical protein
MKKYSFLYLLIGLAILLLLSQKIILPLVYDVVKSDAFLEETQDLPSQYPISNAMTDFAFTHCNNYIKSELGSNATVTFSAKPLKAWTLGNYHYLINGDIGISGTDKQGTHKFVCRIAYSKGNQEEGASDFTNWNIEAIEGIDGM